MKLFIIGENTEAEMSIYGVDGNDHTEEFFILYFSGMGAARLSDEEKKKYNTEADYAITNRCLDCLAENIEKIQKSIDLIAEQYAKNGGDVKEDYTLNDRCFVI